MSEYVYICICIHKCTDITVDHHLNCGFEKIKQPALDIPARQRGLKSMNYNEHKNSVE